MTITADYETLMEQAHQTTALYYRALKREFGEIPPEVMAAMIQASSTDFSAAVISVAIQELAEKIETVG